MNISKLTIIFLLFPFVSQAYFESIFSWNHTQFPILLIGDRHQLTSSGTGKEHQESFIHHLKEWKTLGNPIYLLYEYGLEEDSAFNADPEETLKNIAAFASLEHSSYLIAKDIDNRAGNIRLLDARYLAVIKKLHDTPHAIINADQFKIDQCRQETKRSIVDALLNTVNKAIKPLLDKNLLNQSMQIIRSIQQLATACDTMKNILSPYTDTMCWLDILYNIVDMPGSQTPNRYDKLSATVTTIQLELFNLNMYMQFLEILTNKAPTIICCGMAHIRDLQKMIEDMQTTLQVKCTHKNPGGLQKIAESYVKNHKAIPAELVTFQFPLSMPDLKSAFDTFLPNPWDEYLKNVTV